MAAAQVMRERASYTRGYEMKVKDNPKPLTSTFLQTD